MQVELNERCADCPQTKSRDDLIDACRKVESTVSETEGFKLETEARFICDNGPKEVAIGKLIVARKCGVTERSYPEYIETQGA